MMETPTSLARFSHLCVKGQPRCYTAIMMCSLLSWLLCIASPPFRFEEDRWEVAFLFLRTHWQNSLLQRTV